MKFYSTNRNLPDGFKEFVSFKEALFQGIAPDNGLFMPESIPTFSSKEIEEMQGKSYAEIAYIVLRTFLSEEFDDAILKKITKEAYTFDIPLEEFDEKTFIARLDQGPTASFKDFAAQLMSRLMNELKEKDKKITILAATSGDTGSAVGEAFKDLADFRVFILYPPKEVSSIQKEHMNRIGGSVQALAIDGKFDDCQDIVKKLFLDSELKELNLTSANSINIGRLLPQVVYYFFMYSRLNTTDSIVFSIPSGNFGSSLGCEIARRMGLPVEKIIIATNANDSFPRFLEKGEYKKISPSKECLSNAMNVGNPSNLSRYFDLYGGTLDKEGCVHKMPSIDEMKKHLSSVSISDDTTVATIKKIYQEKHILVEPHGAVGIAALEEFRKENPDSIAICLETAHPVKFPEVIKKELDFSPAVPELFNQGLQRKELVINLPTNYNEIKRYLLR